MEASPVTGPMVLISGIDCLFNEVENSKTVITSVSVLIQRTEDSQCLLFVLQAPPTASCELVMFY